MIQISYLGFDLDTVVTLNQEAQTLLQRVEDASEVRDSLWTLVTAKAIVYNQDPEIRTKSSDSIKIQLAVLLLYQRHENTKSTSRVAYRKIRKKSSLFSK